MEITIEALERQIEQEIACITYLRARIAKWHKRGLYEHTLICFRDIQKSEKRIGELKAQKEQLLLERSRFYNTIQSLNARGILTKPVKKVKEVETYLVDCR